MKSCSEIDIQTAKRLLSFDPDTGFFVWLPRTASDCSRPGEEVRWNGRYAGKEAFRTMPTGYRAGMVKRHMVRAHRLAWLLHYGEWPTGDIDHINGDRADNRIANLRDVSRAENARNQRVRSNNKCGVLGVRKRGNRWQASVWADGKQIHLGSFASLEAAEKARATANAVHGYHANHGRAEHGVEFDEPRQAA